MLVSEDPPPAWMARYRHEGASVVTPRSGWEREPAAWVVLDGYRFGIGEQRCLKDAGHRLAVIDDHGAAKGYAADLVVDQNLGTSAALYADRPRRSSLLLGPTYALLRREFRQQEPRPVRDVATKAIVLLGGSPPPAVAALVEEALESVPNLRQVRPRDDRHVALAMAEADMAVAAAGVTTWELCAMGVPAVLVVAADNQARVASAVAAYGAATSVGALGVATPDRLTEAIGAVASSTEARRSMAEAGRQLVDARGALRVASVLRAALLSRRRATLDDARLLWEWVNDSAARTAAFSREPIDWEHHTAWFAAKLADAGSRIYVAEDEQHRPIGQVRFDLVGAEMEVDVSVAAAQRGRGLGPALIRAGAARAFADLGQPRIIARVRPDNVASVRAFGDAGFRFEGEKADGTNRWLRYALDQDDEGA